MSPYDYLIIGSGLTGAVTARQLTDAGYSCLIVEKRGNVGGNIRDVEMKGVQVHLHGPHLFHTNSDRVWEYVNRFADWEPYEYRVKAMYGGELYSFPPNLKTYEQIGMSEDDPELESRIRAMFFAGYSRKQWGRDLSDIPSRIIKRIPKRTNYDDRYFADKYQGLPVGGYSQLAESIVQGIDVWLNVDYLERQQELNEMARVVIYTGMIDALYAYEYGRLDYRSLNFVTEEGLGDTVGGAAINYTDLSVPYTRRYNWKHFGELNANVNIITTEYPCAYDGMNEPYYPVNDEVNNEVHKRYEQRAEQDGIIIAGRLGAYRYYNMDQAIAAALLLSERLRDNELR